MTRKRAASASRGTDRPSVYRQSQSLCPEPLQSARSRRSWGSWQKCAWSKRTVTKELKFDRILASGLLCVIAGGGTKAQQVAASIALRDLRYRFPR